MCFDSRNLANIFSKKFLFHDQVLIGLLNKSNEPMSRKICSRRASMVSLGKLWSTSKTAMSSTVRVLSCHWVDSSICGGGAIASSFSLPLQHPEPIFHFVFNFWTLKMHVCQICFDFVWFDEIFVTKKMYVCQIVLTSFDLTRFSH